MLANAGVDSRRHVEQRVLDGRITVNGKVVRKLPILIDPAKDKVTADGEAIRLAPRPGGKGRTAGGEAPDVRLYFILNKPKGVYCTNVAQGVQVRAIDLLPDDLPARVYPVGRLDVATTGLLLLTNDGDLTNRLTHPRYGVTKTYRAVVDGSVPDSDIQEMEKGVWIADRRTGKGIKTPPAQIKVVKRFAERSVLDITFPEAKNPEVRRLFARRGHKVRELTRTRLGSLTLDRLKPGHFRHLTPEEVRSLRRLTRDSKGEGAQRNRVK